MELALTHWREKMGSNWQPGLGWIKGGEGTPTGTHFVLITPGQLHYGTSLQNLGAAKKMFEK